MVDKDVGAGRVVHDSRGNAVWDWVKETSRIAIESTSRLLRKLEGLIQELPEVDSYSRRTGLQLGGGLTEANEGDFFIKLKNTIRSSIIDLAGSWFVCYYIKRRIIS